MGSSGAANGGQIENGLPHLTRYITTHDPSTGKAIVHSKDPAPWTIFGNQTIGFSVMYTTSEFPTSLNDDKDIKDHEKVMASGKLGLVNPRGTVCRVVDFGPGHKPLMHRTQSLDYGIVLEGTIEMELDSGEKHTLTRGDVAVQRATMHAWRNVSETEWARMIFVLQDCQPLKIAGQHLKEDLGEGRESLPPSGNDQMTESKPSGRL
jgi:quercetin dioxygenase-like cupin family protein